MVIPTKPLILGAVALLASANAALAQPSTQADGAGTPSPQREAEGARVALEKVCMANRLNRQGALAAAAADGWLELPDGQWPTAAGLHDTIKSLRLTDLSARWKPSSGGGMVLLLGDGGSAGPGCAIAFHAPFSTATARMGISMAFMPRFATISPGYDLWAYVEEGDRRQPLIRNKGFEDVVVKASRARTLSSVAVIGHDETQSSVYLYSVAAPPDAARVSAPPAVFSPDPDIDPASCEAARSAWAAKHGPKPSKRIRLMESGTVDEEFLRFDMDCDQKITLAEYVEMTWYKSYSDAGPDGEISYDEYMGRFCPTFSHLDPVISRRLCEKVRVPLFRQAKAPFRDVITKASYSRVFAADFRRADRNRDGVLTLNKDRRRHAYE